MVSIPIPSGPTAANGPIAAGTRVMMDRSVHVIDRDLISGGAPWRLLRLGSGAHSVVERWRDGGVVRAGEERFASAPPTGVSPYANTPPSPAASQ